LIDAMLSQYGGGISRERIAEICALPIVTVIRLLGCVKKRIDPESVRPGQDADPDTDAAMIAKLEAKLRGDGHKI